MIMIITIILAAIIAALYLRSKFLDLMIKEIKSPFGYQETVERLKKSIGDNPGWHVFNVVDQGGEIVKNGGESAGPITVIQYCHGRHASRMFQSDDRKKISAFSPKAAAVYTKSDGGTYVSMMNGGMMKLVASGEMKDIITEVSSEVKKIMSVLHGRPALTDR